MSIGTPDLGILASGYLGASCPIFTLLSSAARSGICKEEVSSFLLGLSLLFVLLFTDVNALQTSLVPEWFKHVSHYLFVMSPKHWMMNYPPVKLACQRYYILYY